MIDVLTGQLSTMSRHKFASNVCEKAMAVADLARRRRIIEEMLSPGSTGITLVAIMMKDQYANYVLQKAINLVEGDLLQSLVAVVMTQLVNMRRHPSTANSKQLTSIERLLKEKGFTLDAAQPLHLIISPPVSQEDETASGSPTP
jgi:pumilio RNA-binding family